MAGENRKHGESDSTPANKGYNAHYLARKHGLLDGQAREIIREHGHDRDVLNAVAAATPPKRVRRTKQGKAKGKTRHEPADELERRELDV